MLKSQLRCESALHCHYTTHLPRYHIEIVELDDRVEQRNVFGGDVLVIVFLKLGVRYQTQRLIDFVVLEVFVSLLINFIEVDNQVILVLTRTGRLNTLRKSVHSHH